MQKMNQDTESTAHPSWRERILYCVAAIPHGRVATYGQIANLAGLPGYARHVGSVLKNLPKDSKIPWHRVINGQGKIPFQAGSENFRRQQNSLQEENITVLKGRISLRQFRWAP